MGFESQGGLSALSTKSPGGFEFGVQGWMWGDPRPCSITFFLDNTAMVSDQYGRQIRRAVTNEGNEIHFADKPPDGSREGTIQPRPQYATHKQTLDALAAERIDWQAYAVQWVTKSNDRKYQGGLTRDQAAKLQVQRFGENCSQVTVTREIVYAGWPQLPYVELAKLSELPPTPIVELQKILDGDLRRDALKIWRERMEEAEAELSEE